MAEWLLPILEVLGSNPVTGKFFHRTRVKDENKTKERPENGPLKKQRTPLK